jgi:hypothetical protein
MEKIFIGIDPGKNGGIAVIDENGVVIDLLRMPETPMDLLDVLLTYKKGDFLKEQKQNAVCYLEKVGGMPGQSGSAMFTFGRSYGQIEMALLASGITTHEVTPQKWQKHFSLSGSSITKSSSTEKREHKNRLKAKAQQLFPTLGKKITLANCDALLIAQYGREQKG